MMPGSAGSRGRAPGVARARLKIAKDELRRFGLDRVQRRLGEHCIAALGDGREHRSGTVRSATCEAIAWEPFSPSVVPRSRTSRGQAFDHGREAVETAHGKTSVDV